MAITNYLVHFLTEDTYNSKKSELRNDAVAFVKDATIIHTHGTDYYCGSGPVALKSDLENLSEICFVDLSTELNLDTIGSGQSTTAKSGTFQKLLTAFENNQQIIGTYFLETDISLAHIPFSVSYETTTADNSQEVLYLLGILADSILVIIISNNETVVSDSIIWMHSLSTNTGNKVLLSTTNNYQIAESSITSTELGYLDGVTSNIQTQLNGKASTSVATTSANGLMSSSDKSKLDGIAANANNYILPTASASTLGGVKIGSGVNISSGVISVTTSSIGAATTNHTHNTFNNNVTIGAGYNLYIDGPEGGVTLGAIDADGIDILGVQSSGDSNLVAVLTAANYADYITTTDTKNTTGTSNSTSKLYLAGGTSQSSTGVVTYSNSSVYTQSGQLYATQMNATNGFYETSDARLKNFYNDIKALEVVSEIPTKYFTWKKDEIDINKDPQLHIGTSAQEIQKIYPDLVSANENGELSVDYARLSIIALAAIKELKAEVDKLKQQNTKFKI